MLATRDDVVQCYRRFLGRDPENEIVVDRYLSKGFDLWDLVQCFLDCEERKLREHSGSALSIHKCFRGNYLAKSLKEPDRPRCFLSNLDFLQRGLADAAFRRLMDDHVPLLVRGDFNVVVQFSDEIFIEGELTLYLRHHTDRLYVLSFTFVPGPIFGLPAPHAILISRLQGIGGKLDQIRQATKTFDEIAPPALLFAALQGIAKYSGIVDIIGTAGDNHVCHVAAMHDIFAKNYDGFYRSVDGSREEGGFYFVELPLKSKDLSFVKAVHRLRTRTKRRRKAATVEVAGLAWNALRRPGTPQGAIPSQSQHRERDLASVAASSSHGSDLSPHLGL